MISKSMDILVIKGEFKRDPLNKNGFPDIMVQEYKGNMVYLTNNHGKLINLEKDGLVFNLTKSLIEYITDDTSYIEISAIKCNQLEDVLNPVKINKRWELNDKDIKLHQVVRCNEIEPEKIINNINGNSFFIGSNYIYMEIYVHYK